VRMTGAAAHNRTTLLYHWLCPYDR
jgi:hypothetical protein